MARFLPQTSFKRLLFLTWKEFRLNRVLDQSWKLAFFFLLSFFPLLIFLIMLLGILLQSGAEIETMLYEYLSAIAPNSASSLVKNTLKEITSGSNSVKLSLALLFTWWTASQTMIAVIEGMNIAYHVSESRKWWKKYLLATGLTLVCLLLNLITILLLVYDGPLRTFLTEDLGTTHPILSPTFQWGLLIVLALAVFNLIYSFAPNVKTRRQVWIMPGTIIGVLLWLIGSYGFKLYLNYFDRFTVIYGSIGAVIILMIWFYLTGVAILTGGTVSSILKREING